MITIAFVGCAHIHTPGFAKRVAERDDVRAKYTWDPDPERARVRAGEIGAKAVRSRRKIFDDPEVQAVVICSETNRHKRLVPEAVAARKHLFVEKPLAGKGREAWEMARLIEGSGLLFTTGYMMRSNPVNRFLKGEIAAGHLGRITRARGSNCHSGSLGGWFDTQWRWMADPKIAGVGAFGDLGTHSLDLLMWLLGDITRTSALIHPVTGRYDDCDETGEALFAFASGAIGTLAGAWVDVANPVSLLVSGTEGHAAVVDGKLYYKSSHVEGADGKQPWTALSEPLAHPIELFFDAVAGRPDVPLVTPAEAASRVAVMEAMYASAKRGRWVEVKAP